MRDSSPFNQQAFYAQVWNLVRQVPRGKVVTYGQIAQMLPTPAEMDLQSYQAAQSTLGGQRHGGLSCGCAVAAGHQCAGEDQRQARRKETAATARGRGDRVRERQG
jgi:hypothetical protein